MGFPSAVAYQDMVSFVSGLEGQKERWGAFVEKSVAGSVHQAEMPFVDSTMTGSLSGSGLQAPGVGSVAFVGKNGSVSETPDELRVNRGEKRGRIVNVAPVAPPKSFSAGSVFDRTSSLLDTGVAPQLRMAFVAPDIKGHEIQIAGAFHLKEEKKLDPGVPAMLASLITSEKADVLATAYAPSEPDYAAASPFASLLKDEDPNAGRFVPPIAQGDHAWMSKPLPASVFSDKEQKCLAEGIYFEARGEDLKGQAAVAQVILNRVRNPAYPATICGVVYQNENWRNRCQFSFACDGTRPRVRSPYNYKVAQDIAMAVTAGKIFIPEVGSATHYHATYVHPRWARTMEKVKKIGLHIFYRTYGGGWS
ncbi:cell wall hydrolase [Aquamicrobium sp. LC103]|uniref:cell wall hydrolase n=1 Tax=Aquamicrobium sp. LC103 TaxID=1120658 RepID=UPI000A76F6F0|nr:cell wall hydrolase [Aquamicrobium sp. LC103]TKT81094.1 cell wall hydrolase [Aquamicrobium sp. LC103]